MLIMQIEALEGGYHPFQSQTGRTECWLPGYIEVPPAFSEALHSSCGYCEPVIEGGVLIALLPGILPAPLPVFDPVTDLELLAIDHELRLTLLELGL